MFLIKKAIRNLHTPLRSFKLFQERNEGFEYRVKARQAHYNANSLRTQAEGWRASGDFARARQIMRYAEHADVEAARYLRLARAWN